MKVPILNILFSEPDVFSVFPEWPKEPDYSINDVQHSHNKNNYDAACEQSKANAIRIENKDIFVKFSIHSLSWKYKDLVLKHGDIFQVEGFEYDVNQTVCGGPCSEECQESGCRGIEVAIIKLAKEEEPKEQIDNLHNKIMTQWEKDYGSIHSEQKMDAYTVSGFIREVLKK